MGDYYMSWLGCSAFGVAGARPAFKEVPIVFSPTDISDCVIWYDAANTASIITDVSNTSLVVDWMNLGTWGGKLFTTVDTFTGTGQTGIDTINGLNAVLFGESNIMVMKDVSGINQERTAFFVSRGLTDLSGWYAPYMNYFAGNMVYDMQYAGLLESGLYKLTLCANGYFCPIDALSADFYNNAYSICFRNSSTDIAKNLVSINGTELLYGTSVVSDYFSTGPSDFFVNRVETAQDIGEIIFYNRLLTDTEVGDITNYLLEKWGLVAIPQPQFPIKPIPPPEEL